MQSSRGKYQTEMCYLWQDGEDGAGQPGELARKYDAGGKMIEEINSIEDIQTLVKSGFEDWKKYGDVSANSEGDLLIFNYTPKAQYSGRWNYFERVSRGLIINKVTGGIVARPFDKFFNWTERGEKSDGHIVSITEKIDGSLGVFYRTDEGYKIATRGSFSGEQAIWATEYLKKYNLPHINNDLTLLFEIIYPENRIVIDYGERKDLVLLAIRNRFTGEYLPFFPDVYEFGNALGFHLPKVYKFNDITEIIELTGKMDADQEGFVVEFSDGQRFKFKGDRYLELHRLISGLSFKHTLEAIAGGKLDYIRGQIPNEFLSEFNGWVEEIDSKTQAIEKAVKTAFDIAPKESRKDFAVWVMGNCEDLAPYLFAMLDGRDITPMIYQGAFKDREDPLDS
jgi:RNA ligase